MAITIEVAGKPVTIHGPAGAVERVAFDPAEPHQTAPTEVEELAVAQIEEYLAGTRSEFTVPVAMPATETFRGQVQRALLDIPCGQTWTYAELAAHVGNPKAARAVGTACATNPLPILVPCHRVVRAGGDLGNYLGGAEIKRMLLAVEGYTK